MTDANDRPPDCRTVRDEFPALLYGELDAESAQLVEQHLDTCPGCRAELEGHRRTVRHLDAWTIDCDQPGTGAYGALSHRRSRILRLRPVLVGTAAAAVVFAVMGAVGSDLQYADGQLTLTLGRSSTTTLDRISDWEAITSLARAVAREESDTSSNTLLEVLDSHLAELRRDAERHRLMLASAVDLRRDEDLRQQLALFDALAGQFDIETMRTHNALDDIWTRISKAVPAIEPDSDRNRKEPS